MNRLTLEELFRAVNAARAEERQRCIEACRALISNPFAASYYARAVNDCIAAIRALEPK